MIFFYIKIFRIAPTCFDPKIIFRELHCSLLKFIYFTNGRYIDCLSLTYTTNQSKTLKLQCRYKKNIQSKYESPNDKK